MIDIPTRAAGETAFDWAARLSRAAGSLWATRPRTLRRLFGTAGPTPEQLAAWQADRRSWNARYRQIRKAWLAAIDESNRDGRS